MRAKSSLPPQSLSNQSGIALVTVLLFLMLIMIIGAIAVRQANVDLNVAASDQVGTLLINNSDSVLAHVEIAAGDNKNPQYGRIMSQTFGLLGYFTVNSESKVGHQVSTCYRPNSAEMFNKERAYIRQLGGAKYVSKDKSCNANSSGDYSSNRNTAMTQIIVRGLRDENSDDFNSAARGTTEGGIAPNASPKIQLNSVSVLPAMSDKSADQIKDCLGRPVGNATEYGFAATEKNANVNDCLRSQNIPATFVVEEGLLRDDEKGGFSGTGVNNACKNDAACAAAMGLQSSAP